MSLDLSEDPRIFKPEGDQRSQYLNWYNFQLNHLLEVNFERIIRLQFLSHEIGLDLREARWILDHEGLSAWDAERVIEFITENSRFIHVERTRRVPRGPETVELFLRPKIEKIDAIHCILPQERLLNYLQFKHIN